MVSAVAPKRVNTLIDLIEAVDILQKEGLPFPLTECKGCGKTMWKFGPNHSWCPSCGGSMDDQGLFKLPRIAKGEEIVIDPKGLELIEQAKVRMDELLVRRCRACKADLNEEMFCPNDQCDYSHWEQKVPPEDIKTMDPLEIEKKHNTWRV